MSIAAPMPVVAQRSILLLLVCGFAALATTMGVRTTFGIFLGPIAQDTGWSIEALSLALAAQNLIWGMAQPFAGMAADKRGAAIVVAAGALLYGVGLALMAFANGQFWLFSLATGLLIGVGQAAIGFPVVLGAIGRTASPARRSLYLGIATAGGSFGQLLFAPLGQVLFESMGWINALLVMAVICVGIAFLGLGMLSEVRNPPASLDPAEAARESLTTVLGNALRHRGFLLLTAGFFVCGFQLAFISFHLPMFAALCGLGSRAGATGLALIGGFNIIGTIVAGQLGGLYRPKFPLAWIYLGRGLCAAMIVILPVTETTLYTFSVLMGLLWLSTVPLTNGIIVQIFGNRHVGLLFGIVFLSHQLGSFAGLWIAGAAFERFGSYDLIWWLSALLGVMAAVVNLPIDDRRAATDTQGLLPNTV